MFSTSETIVVLDFETSGISPDHGDRAIEIGAVMLRQGEVVDHCEVSPSSKPSAKMRWKSAT